MPEFSNGKVVEAIYDIRERVIKVEEHLKTQNGRINKVETKVCTHDTSIDSLNVEIAKISIWDKVKTIAIVVVFGIASSTVTYLLTH